MYSIVLFTILSIITWLTAILSFVNSQSIAFGILWSFCGLYWTGNLLYEIFNNRRDS